MTNERERERERKKKKTKEKKKDFWVHFSTLTAEKRILY
jgi:hypothetical protein